MLIVGTTQAAKILKISTARMRTLLAAGRVQGAYKSGKLWLMPLINGKPIISKGKRGPAPSWKNPPQPAKTIIHVNSHLIKKNKKENRQEAVITVKTGNTNIYGHEVEIPGGCRVVYSPHSPKSSGAQVWIETFHQAVVTCWDKLGAALDDKNHIPSNCSTKTINPD